MTKIHMHLSYALPSFRGRHRHELSMYSLHLQMHTHVILHFSFVSQQHMRVSAWTYNPLSYFSDDSAMQRLGEGLEFAFDEKMMILEVLLNS